MDNRVKDCRHGKMLYNTNDIYMGKALDNYGEYSEAELNILGQLIAPGQLVLDIGANIGCHTVFFAEKVGQQGWVFAFEPQRVIFQNLCANVALNNLANVFCEHTALGKESGRCFIPSFNYDEESNFGAISLEQYTTEQGEPVEIKTLDSYNLPQCHLMKIDVEGMESLVLEGAKNTINKFRPVIFLENDRAEKSKELIAQLRSYDYTLYWVVTGLYNANNYFNNPNDIYKNVVTVNMLCLPKEREQHIDLPLVKPEHETWNDAKKDGSLAS